MQKLMPEPLRAYGQLKFLTYQCLLIQVLNSFLHVAAHFIRALEKPRDFVFTTLAYPVGSIVVYSFWAVWHLMGRQFIFPVELSQYYPDWLNHATHTIIAPLNIVLLLTIHHKYPRNGAWYTTIYFALYTIWLHFIKFQSGHFVYRYLEAMDDMTRVVYFLLTGIFAYLAYKSGQYLTGSVHGKASQRPVLKKNKQK